MTDGAPIYISFVAPAHNEQENVSRLVEEIAAAGEAVGKPWEVIVVNDASTDATPQKLRELMAQYPQLRVLSMQSRSGQTAAVETGLRAARGQYLAMLDADLQNDPADVRAMLALIERDECDMVNGWRRDRHDPWIRLLSTRVANRVRNALTRESIQDSACGLKVFRRQCIERVKFFNGMHRFLPTLVKMEGYRVVEMPVNHRPRAAGKAKYGVMNRVFRALRDAFAVRWMQSRIVRSRFEEWQR